MTYAIIVPQTPFQSKNVQVRDYYLGKNKLWAVNDGEMLLHHAKGSDSFLNEIGVVKVGGKAKYAKYTEEEMVQIFKHYYQTGELLTVRFHSGSEDYEVESFFNKIQYKKNKTKEQVDDMVYFYEYIVENLTGKPWYFVIVKNDMQIHLYQSSSVFVSGISGNEEETALLVFEELSKLLNKKWVLSEIDILEKEKIDHPMKNAHLLLVDLFQAGGENVSTRLGMSNSEHEYIKNELLKYTKEFETKKVYK
jgi:hypothetical protein